MACQAKQFFSRNNTELRKKSIHAIWKRFNKLPQLKFELYLLILILAKFKTHTLKKKVCQKNIFFLDTVITVYSLVIFIALKSIIKSKHMQLD